MTSRQDFELVGNIMLLAVLGVGVSFPHIPVAVISKHLLRIGHAAKADLAVWT